MQKSIDSTINPSFPLLQYNSRTNPTHSMTRRMDERLRQLVKASQQANQRSKMDLTEV